VVPLQGVRFGQQVSWYAGRVLGSQAPAYGVNPPNTATLLRAPPDKLAPRGVVAQITGDFVHRRLDLSARPGAPVPGWESMPEVVVAKTLAEARGTGIDLRVYLTLVSAMDRARDATYLWNQATKLFLDDRRFFDPAWIAAAPLRMIRDGLAKFGVSQRHGPDSAAWKLIAEALVDADSPAAVRRAVFDGVGDAQEVLAAVTEKTSAGNRGFPCCPGRRFPPCGPGCWSLPAAPR
jgi:hypothetical protein